MIDVILAAVISASTYTVQPGDTLSSIGEKVGIPWYQICVHNKLIISDCNKINVGLVIALPSDQDEAVGFSHSENEVIVKEGDTLSGICRQLGYDVDEVYRLNRDEIGPNPNLIHPGMKLRLS